MLSILVLAATVGCVSRIADLSLVANRNITAPTEVMRRGVTGRHCQVQWTLGQQPSLEEAIDLAQKSVPEANALSNVAVYYETQWYVLLTRFCFRVEGDAVRIGG